MFCYNKCQHMHLCILETSVSQQHPWSPGTRLQDLLVVSQKGVLPEKAGLSWFLHVPGFTSPKTVKTCQSLAFKDGLVMHVQPIFWVHKGFPTRLSPAATSMDTVFPHPPVFIVPPTPAGVSRLCRTGASYATPGKSFYRH